MGTKNIDELNKNPITRIPRSVLVLGARAPVCLEWIRALSASGISVCCADSLTLPLARWAKGSDHYFQLPAPRKNVNRWGRALQQIVEKYDIDLVIPTCEEAFYLSHQRSRFKNACELFTMPFEMMGELHHKGLFADRIVGWPLSAPETHLVKSEKELLAFSAESRNWVFKPAYSRFAARTLIRPSCEKLLTIHPIPAQPWVVQRWIEGRELCTYSLFREGTLRAHACYHPKYRVGSGSGMYLEPMDSSSIENFLTHFGRETQYTGQVGFDFIESLSGETFVLECNPRATSGVHLFRNRQTDLVNTLWNDTPNVLKPHQTPRAIGLCMGIFGVGRYGRATEFWSDWWKASDVIVSINDLGPACAQIFGLVEIVLRALKNSSRLIPAATSDIEWDGEPLGPVD